MTSHICPRPPNVIAPRHNSDTNTPVSASNRYFMLPRASPNDWNGDQQSSLHLNSSFEICHRPVNVTEPMRRARRHDDDVAFADLSGFSAFDALAAYQVGAVGLCRRRVQGATGHKRPAPVSDLVDLNAQWVNDRVLRLAP